jgi:hypothetical protein
MEFLAQIREMRIKLVGRFSFALMMFVLCGVKALAAPASNGWILRQTSDEYGILETMLTSKALRLDTPELTILLLPPNYPLFIYNKKTKRYIEEPSDAFVVHTRPNRIKPHIRVDKQSDVTICGVKANRYLCVDTRQGNQKPRFEFSATRNLNVPDKLADACMIFFSVPDMTPGHGLPLSALRLSPGGAKFVYVTTRSLQRAYIAPETFVKPKGLEKVDNFVALSSDGENIPIPGAHALDYMLEDAKKK